jgi:ABC-type multidrug transport system fused ATPase/permease subunit
MLPLHKARRGLSIIPQEPVMFSGAFRENLDPYHEHSDFELYNLLVEAGLKEQSGMPQFPSAYKTHSAAR